MTKSNHSPPANGSNSPFTVLLLSTLMFMSSFLAGVLPLFLALSARRLRILTSLGAGLLIGTALAVIIPEGVGALFAWENGHAHQSIGSTDSMAVASVISFALVLGFMGMYLVDIWPSLLSIPPSRDVLPIREIQSESVNEESASIPLQTTTSESRPPYPQEPHSSRASILTTGMLIHSLADGVALGTSASLPSTSLVVFFAILTHKAPAAFGLTAALLRQGMSKRGVRGWLLLFSGAAPAGALISWLTLRMLGGQFGGANGAEEWWAGAGMVLSGGTFLYVAMHSMSMAGGQQGNSHSHELMESGQQTKQEMIKMQRVDVLYTVLGMLLPLMTRMGHGHDHGH